MYRFFNISLCSLFLVLISLSGCIEHTFNINVLDDDSVEIGYHALGDPMDFDDQGQLLPDSTIWRVRRWMEEKDDEKELNVEAHYSGSLPLNLDSLLDWQREISDSLNLKSDFTLVKEKRIFGDSYIFRGVLYSRNFILTYGDIWDYIPSECKILEDEEGKNSLTSDEIQILEDKFALGVIQWNINRYNNLIDRVWQNAIIHEAALRDTSRAILSISEAEWAEDLHQYMNMIDIKNPSTLDLDWWEELRPILLGRLVDMTGAENADLFRRIGNSLEEEYQITKDIEDDNYKFVLKLPGIHVSSNGEKSDDGLIRWEISGKEIQDEDMIMEADTFRLSIWRTVTAAFILILTLNILKRLISRKTLSTSA